MHGNNIIHRDLKPENLVFDLDGYVKVTDLGVAKMIRPNNSSDTSGTPGYMAPEVMCRMNHSFQSDFYALGVIAYEMMLRKVALTKTRDLPQILTFFLISKIKNLLKKIM